MPVLNGYLNVTETSSLLGLHPETIKRFCRERRLAADKVNNAWLIHQDVVASFAASYAEHRGRPSRNKHPSELDAI